ncbi:MAG TPA: pyridoxamine 5'-phosphate oxidase family protein [Polyangiales bacterium]|nr:pyridoxamine 5'-phosphate oxidase family protein [Polyangiales bacterium]
MNSIDQQQAEETHENLHGVEAIDKIKEMVKEAKTCFFCTSIMTGKAVPTRPMSVLQIDDRGTLWFLSAKDSQKNQELAHDPAVQLLFQGSTHADFLMLYGRAVVSSDKKKIKELWSPLLKTWFTEGVDDPRISVIELAPSHGYYWDTKHNRMIALAKMVAGAVVGKTMDDSIQGGLKV